MMASYEIKAPCEREDELLIELCREAGGLGTDEELIEGAQINHDQENIAEPGQGDITALICLRAAFGLPTFMQ